VLAVQRANGEENRETVVIDSRSLHEASRDTLLPLYSLIGSPLNEKSFIGKGCNIIVEDNITYSYITALAGLIKFNKDVHFIPSSSLDGIPVMVNLFMGWKLDFGILLTDSGESSRVADFIKNTAFLQDEKLASQKIKIIRDIPLIEDIFSTIDFKRYILQQRFGITERNSAYITEKGLSRLILAKNFHTKIISADLKFDDLDEETKVNTGRIFYIIDNMTCVGNGGKNSGSEIISKKA
jgi:hypothetical protein